MLQRLQLLLSVAVVCTSSAHQWLSACQPSSVHTCAARVIMVPHRSSTPTHLTATRGRQRRAPSWQPRPRPHPHGKGARGRRSRRRAACDRRDALPRGAPAPPRPRLPFAAAAAGGEQRLARWRGSEEGGLPRLPPHLRLAPAAAAARWGLSAAHPCPMHLPRPLLHVRAFSFMFNCLYGGISSATIANTFATRAINPGAECSAAAAAGQKPSESSRLMGYQSVDQHQN